MKMSIYDKLYPFQKNVVDKFRSYKKFGLFLDMGLGKTPTSLAKKPVLKLSLKRAKKPFVPAKRPVKKSHAKKIKRLRICVQR